MFTRAVLTLVLASCAAIPTDTSAKLDSLGFRGPARDGNFGGRVPHRKPQIAWTFQADGPIRSSPIAVGDALIFGSGDGVLHAVDCERGREIWSLSAGSPLDGPAAFAAGNVVAQTRDGRLLGVDARTGALRWSLALGADAHSDWDYEFFVSGPASDGTRVYAGSGHGEVVCVDARSGDVIWRFMTNGRVRASPSIDTGVVYVGSFDGHVYALDAANGAQLWKFATKGVSIDCQAAGFDRRSVQGSTAVTRELVLVGGRDGHFYAIDRRAGVERWSSDHETSWVVSSPAVSGSTVVVGTSDGRFVQALELASGRELWRHRTDSNSQPSPAIAGDVVVTGDSLGSILALDLASGRELWRVPTGDAVYSSPLVRDGRIFVGSDDGRMYALSGDLDAPARTARRAVYYDRTVPYRYFSGDRELRAALMRESYETLSRQNLAAFLEERIADRSSSVIVLATDVLPSNVLDEPEGGACLLRRYLDAGGKLVWVGCPPLCYTFDATSGQMIPPTQESLARFRSVLDMQAAPPDEGACRAQATELGKRWGLPDGWFMSHEALATAPGEVDVLASDEHGHAAAWVKSFGGRPGSGFVRCWGSERPLPDPTVIVRLAEYGLD